MIDFLSLEVIYDSLKLESRDFIFLENGTALDYNCCWYIYLVDLGWKKSCNTRYNVLLVNC